MRTTNPFFFLSIFYKARMAVFFSFIALLAACTATVLPNGDLPVVDLGYELHQAISFNVRPSEVAKLTSDLINLSCLERI